MNSPRLRRFYRLRLTRRPANDGLLNARVLAQSEMEATLVLGAESAAARHLLHLLLPVPKQPHLSANRAAVARRPLKLEADPAVLGQGAVFVDEQRPFLIRYDHI